MKIASLSLSILLSFTTLLYSQESEEENFEKSIYFEVIAGPSIPVGDFGSDNSKSSKSGLAVTGYLLEVDLEMDISELFGFAAMVRRTSHGFNNAALDSDLTKHYRGVRFSVQSGSYIVLGFMGGFYGQIALDPSSKVLFQMKGMVGYMNCTYPEVKINSSYSSQSIKETYFKSNASAVGFLLGGGIHFKINPKTKFLVNIDYMLTQPEFNIRYSAHFSNGSKDYDYVDQELLMESLNFGLGFAFLM